MHAKLDLPELIYIISHELNFFLADEKCDNPLFRVHVGVVVGMFDFHSSNRGSNPGHGGKISCLRLHYSGHPWQASGNHKPWVHPNHVREIGQSVGYLTKQD